MKYIASCSFGKDSLATIILAKLNNEPIDEVIFSEVMYSHEKNISGENPVHIKWIHEVAIPKLKSWGLKITILKSKDDYLSCFYKVKKRGKRVGEIYGFPMGGFCVINHVKVDPINSYLRKQKEFIQYIGIAVDEPKRLERLHKDPKKKSLLEKYGYTEEMASNLCEEHGLLSPSYKYFSRNGCWFCPNMRINDVRLLRSEFPFLWSELLRLDKTPNIPGTYKYGKTVQHFEDRFSKE